MHKPRRIYFQVWKAVKSADLPSVLHATPPRTISVGYSMPGGKRGPIVQLLQEPRNNFGAAWSQKYRKNCECSPRHSDCQQLLLSYTNMSGIIVFVVSLVMSCLLVLLVTCQKGHMCLQTSQELRMLTRSLSVY